jgi:hypothetical protein
VPLLAADFDESSSDDGRDYDDSDLDSETELDRAANEIVCLLPFSVLQASFLLHHALWMPNNEGLCERLCAVWMRH